MQLSLLHLCSRILLLTWVSTLLPGQMGQIVASQPECVKKNGNCHLTFQGLIMRAAFVSQHLSAQSFQLLDEFVTQYGQSRRYLSRNRNSCHTASLATPEYMEEALELQPEVLLQFIVSLLGSWTEPMQQLVREIGYMQGSPDALLSIARNINKKGKALLEFMKRMLKKIPEEQRREVKYAVWPGLAALQVADEESRHFAFYNLFHCLSKDMDTVNMYFKTLKCQFIHPSYC